MKLSLFLVVVCVAVVSSEMCSNTDTTTCIHEVCGSGQVPTCQNNVCTCAAPPSGSIRDCGTLSDCINNGYYQQHHCDRDKRHCIDGRCQCKDLD